MSLIHKPLTDRQKAMLDLMRQHVGRPTVALRLRDFMDRLGFRSTSAVSYNLKALENAGHIRLHERKTDHIELVQHGPTPAQQIQALKDVIQAGASDLEEWAEHTDDEDQARSLFAIAAALRCGAADAMKGQP